MVTWLYRHWKIPVSACFTCQHDKYICLARFISERKLCSCLCDNSVNLPHQVTFNNGQFKRNSSHRKLPHRRHYCVKKTSGNDSDASFSTDCKTKHSKSEEMPMGFPSSIQKSPYCVAPYHNIWRVIECYIYFANRYFFSEIHPYVTCLSRAMAYVEDSDISMTIKVEWRRNHRHIGENFVVRKALVFKPAFDSCIT